jgi:hypothetical protein
MKGPENLRTSFRHAGALKTACVRLERDAIKQLVRMKLLEEARASLSF